jgi:hypothetical protein
MRPAKGRNVYVLPKLLACATVWAIVFLHCAPAAAQQPSRDSVQVLTDSTKTVAQSNEPDIITTFQALNFPPEMLMHYGQISPKEMVTLIDEFQVTQKDEDGIAMLITVKLHFDSDMLVGYIREAPIDNTQDVTVSDFIVRIPVEWLCTPGRPEHQQHYVSSLAAIKTAETQYKCTGWHIKLPELERPDLGRGKKKKGKKEKAPKKGKAAAKPAS